ncbi:MAG: hypothetical protein CMH52_09125 [Myxococcales bacterium]|nr:hypothetical protein [Myxococcales bacterium]|tara:strand:+ start:1003 stop:1563 length:561 start_codon:yes stop_codon:yes gene_type:complete
MNFLETIPVVLVLVSALSIVWFTLKTGISPMPSSNQVIGEVCSLAQANPVASVYELGSGWGGLAIAIAKANPKSAVVGYEMSTLPWLFSSLRNHLSGAKNLTLIRRDFMQTNLTDADLIVCYLYPEAMKRLADHLRTQLKGDITVISNTFRLPGFQPKMTVFMTDMYRTPLYLYELRASEIGPLTG